MSPVQTSYSIGQEIGYHGALADLSDNDIVSNPANGIVGVGVAVGYTDIDGKLVEVGVGVGFAGISLRDISKEAKDIADDTLEYADGDTVSNMKRGRVFLELATAADNGAALKFDDVTGVIDTGAAEVGETAIVGAELEGSVVDGGIGVVFLTGQI